jgi:hypothetical protein
LILAHIKECIQFWRKNAHGGTFEVEQAKYAAAGGCYNIS